MVLFKATTPNSRKAERKQGEVSVSKPLLARFLSDYSWEVWSDKGGYDSTYGHMGFFCNTADVSFVFLTDTYFDKSIFYDMWSKGGFGDPRSDDKNL